MLEAQGSVMSAQCSEPTGNMLPAVPLQVKRQAKRAEAVQPGIWKAERAG